MARQRFNAARICSSDNYKESKKAHVSYLQRTHQDRLNAIDKIPVKPSKKLFGGIKSAFIYSRFPGQPYPGKKITIPHDMIESIAALGYAIHYENINI